MHHRATHLTRLLADGAMGFCSAAAGVSACKAAVDFGIDLRSHDPNRTWGGRYVDV